MKVEEFAREYFKQLREGIDNLSLKKIESIINILYQAYRKERQVFIMGNGGRLKNLARIASSSQQSHESHRGSSSWPDSLNGILP